jgi:hypothetical protein
VHRPQILAGIACIEQACARTHSKRAQPAKARAHLPPGLAKKVKKVEAEGGERVMHELSSSTASSEPRGMRISKSGGSLTGSTTKWMGIMKAMSWRAPPDASLAVCTCGEPTADVCGRPAAERCWLSSAPVSLLSM